MKLDTEMNRLKNEEERLKLLQQLEEEVKLRILFEQKLNSLHLVNMEADTRAIMYRERLQIMEVNYLNG